MIRTKSVMSHLSGYVYSLGRHQSDIEGQSIDGGSLTVSRTSHSDNWHFTSTFFPFSLLRTHTTPSPNFLGFKDSLGISPFSPCARLDRASFTIVSKVALSKPAELFSVSGGDMAVRREGVNLPSARVTECATSTSTSVYAPVPVTSSTQIQKAPPYSFSPIIFTTRPRSTVHFKTAMSSNQVRTHFLIPAENLPRAETRNAGLMEAQRARRRSRLRTSEGPSRPSPSSPFVPCS